MITVFLIITAALLVTGLLLRLTHRPDSEPSVRQQQPEEEEECCGQHQICERESLLSAVSRRIEYFDDEELDRFRGRTAEAYTDSETDEFRQVMLSMHEDEVAAWARSLQLREVEIPLQLRDELFLIIGELRQSPHQNRNRKS